jgi:cytoskeletal protein RodZ
MSIKKRKRIVLFFLLLLILCVSCLGLLWRKNTKSPSKQDTTKESVQEEREERPLENVDEEYVTSPSDDPLKTMPYDQNKNYKKILIE